MPAFNRLSGATMRTISSQWLDDDATRQVLDSFDKTRALLPDIEQAHVALLKELEADDGAGLDAEIADLRAAGEALDERHDRKYRGTYKLLDALAELADSPETATALLALRDRLHPNGLPQVNLPWAAEAGNAATVRAGLDEGARAELQAVASIEGRTLYQEADAWLTAAEGLGPVAAQKAAAEHQAQNPGTESKALTKARNHWVKVARALESSLDLVANVTAKQQSAVLGLLYSEAVKAEQRGAQQRTPAPADPPPPVAPKKDPNTV